ncbi:MAG: hypothetical protein WAN06_00230 [Candidatus Sulfotelmatobacter sp.]
MSQHSAEVRSTQEPLTQEPLTREEYDAAQNLLRFCADERVRLRLDYELLAQIARLESAVYRQLMRGAQ